MSDIERSSAGFASGYQKSLEIDKVNPKIRFEHLSNSLSIA